MNLDEQQEDEYCNRMSYWHTSIETEEGKSFIGFKDLYFCFCGSEKMLDALINEDRKDQNDKIIIEEKKRFDTLKDWAEVYRPDKFVQVLRMQSIDKEGKKIKEDKRYLKSGY